MATSSSGADESRTPTERKPAVPAAPKIPAVSGDSTAAGEQAKPAEAPSAPAATAPAISEHPFPAALTQLQDIKGDAAVLLHTAAKLITDETDRLRSETAKDREEINQLQERAHQAEIRSSVLGERARDASSQRRLRDGTLALGGVLAGIGFTSWQQIGWLGGVIFVVGVAMIVIAAVFVPPLENR